MIFILGFLTSLTPFSIDLYLPAFPAIAHDLHTTLSKVSLSISFYFVAYAVGQILYGPFLDRFGRKPPVYVGITIYILASFGCMMAQSITSLIVFRVISALGGSAATVGANAMVRDYFPQKEVARVFSFLVLVISLSPFLAPTVGTLVVLHWNWRFVFAVLSGVAVLDIVLVALLPNVYKPDPTVTLSLKPIYFNFQRILKNKHFATYTFSGALTFSGLFVFVSGAPSIFFDEFKINQKSFALIFALLVSGLIGGSQLNHILVKRVGSAKTFKRVLILETIASVLFFAGSCLHLYNVVGTGLFLFIALMCAGIASPNAAALALEPFFNPYWECCSLIRLSARRVGRSHFRNSRSFEWQSNVLDLFSDGGRLTSCALYFSILGKK